MKVYRLKNDRDEKTREGSPPSIHPQKAVSQESLTETKRRLSKKKKGAPSYQTTKRYDARLAQTS